MKIVVEISSGLHAIISQLRSKFDEDSVRTHDFSVDSRMNGRLHKHVISGVLDGKTRFCDLKT